MNAKRIPLYLLLSFILRVPVFAQGSLTPPGAPAPTMKSLDQIEARTAISSAPFTISGSGSYYLTKNLNVTNGDAITITSNGVTLDLNGFTISSTANPAGGTGVLLTNAVQNVTILNGHIAGGVTYNVGGGTYTGPGFANGIFYSGTTPSNVRVSGISVSGCQLYGINVYSGSTIIDSCTTHTIGATGLTATTVSRSTAFLCGGGGINAANASDSFGYSTGSDDAIHVNVATNCYGYCIGGGAGLYANTATNCWGRSDGNTGFGIFADNANTCYGRAEGGAGIVATTAINSRAESHGIFPGMTAEVGSNSYGIAFGNGATGFQGDTATNCYGISQTGVGLSVNTTIGIAIGCYGQSGSATALQAFIANSCSATGPVSITHKYNMP